MSKSLQVLLCHLKFFPGFEWQVAT
ncbi:hypothetical protein KUF71_002038 [Frankliniella fusca]|uniref:Uncharacterized protein n=1 Tax=Frankliniella fusca TaxID=407009 RepID=A0AAE1LL79_9NEOP|nr:hypothetical protein KUF71_002038 [Frankliniella fusca]